MNQDLHFPVRQWCQSLNAVSHSVGAHSNALGEVDNQSDSDDETDGDAAAAEPQHTQPPAAQSGSDDHAGEVCLTQPRESRLVLVPCGHCRCCESCANEVHRIALCHTPIDMILHLY